MYITNKFSAYRFLIAGRNELREALNETSKYYYVDPTAFKKARKRLKFCKCAGDLNVAYVVSIASSLCVLAGDLYANAMGQNTALPSMANRYGVKAKLCLSMAKMLESEVDLLNAKTKNI